MARKKTIFEEETPQQHFERRIKEIAEEFNEFFNKNEGAVKHCGVVFLAALEKGESYGGQTFIIGAPGIITATITQSCNNYPVFSKLLKHGLAGTHQ